VNADGRVNVFYSSPAAYTDAKHAYNASWPLKTDDFFPYADCPTCYWTGALLLVPRARMSALGELVAVCGESAYCKMGQVA
jgi:hypothetical protein